MSRSANPVVALVWPQLSAYHVDRCAALGRALSGHADVLACEIATRSALYAWDPSGDIPGAHKVTLFPGAARETLPWARQFRALWRAVRGADAVFIGVSYARPEIVLLAWVLRLAGRPVFMMTESKFDDRPRRVEIELLKMLVLGAYRGALVGGRRQADYVRFLGFRRRPVTEGYDCVGLDRVRDMAGAAPAPQGLAFEERPFVFVARLVAKKNAFVLLDAYARYLDAPESSRRPLLIVGGGELENELLARIAALNLGEQVRVTGFVQASEVAGYLAKALALILPSTEEQWGLVVNEALAFHLPVIVSENVGARDALVRNLVNGFVVEPDNVEGLAEAMLRLDRDPALWRRMVDASARVAALADAPRFAAGVEDLLARTGILAHPPRPTTEGLA